MPFSILQNIDSAMMKKFESKFTFDIICLTKKFMDVSVSYSFKEVRMVLADFDFFLLAPEKTYCEWLYFRDGSLNDIQNQW